MELSYDAVGFTVHGERRALISAEMHYFRVPRKDWRYRIGLMKEAGVQCVATYAPWAVHEETPGQIAFDDRPGRELTAFLQLCKEEGMLVMIRPGPYQYTEMLWDGLPAWLMETYPAIMARDAKGGALYGAVSYLHPLFLEKARAYFRAVNAVIRPFLLKNGGTVCLVQPDNELAGVHIWRGSLDYHPEVMGFGRADGRYPRWLRERYATLEVLNDAYGKAYASFEEVRPVDDDPREANAYLGGQPDTLYGARRAKDYYRFYCATLAEYLDVLTGWFREDGIDADFCHNAAGTGMLPHFLESLEGERYLLGVDHYYNLGPAWGQNNPTPQYALNVLMSMDYLYALGLPPTVFELQAGNLADFPPMLREDCKACYFTNTAFGMKGMNYYIFTGGPNFGNTGTTGPVYDFNAPVSADNAIRPTYHAIAEHNDFLSSHGWMQDARRSAGLSLGFTWDGQRCAYSDPSGQPFSDMEAWENLRSGLLFTALCGGYQPELREVGGELPLDRPLWLSCGGTMAAEKQRRLIRYVQEGGRLILSPVVPVLDENYQPCTLLKEYLQIGEIVPIANCNGILELWDGVPVHQVYKQFTCDGMGEGAAVLARNQRDGSPIAYEKRLGDGRAVWLGAAWNYIVGEQIGLVERLCERLGARAHVRRSNPALWVAVWENGEKATVFVMNLFSGRQETELAVFVRGAWRELGRVRVAAMDVATVDI